MAVLIKEPSSFTSLPLPERLVPVPRAEGLELVIGRALSMTSRPLRKAALPGAGLEIDLVGTSLAGATLADLAGPLAEPRFAAGPVVFPPPTRCRRADMGTAAPAWAVEALVLGAETTRALLGTAGEPAPWSSREVEPHIVVT